MKNATPLAALATLVLLAALALLAFLRHAQETPARVPPPATAPSESAPQNPAPAHQPVMVESVPLSPGELEALADLFEKGGDDRRTFTGLFGPGESMLCDIFEDRVRLPRPHLSPTVAPHQVEDSAPAQIIFRQQTILLRADGSSNQVLAPTIVAGENQEATVTIGRGDSSYSMSVRALLVDEEQVQVSVEFQGQPLSLGDPPLSP